MKIGIIAALPFEVEIIKNQLSDLSEKIIASSSYYSGKINDKDVVIMQCGMGKVSAALGTQALISEYHCDIVINTGCAGALNSKLDIGDIVLSTCAIEWDIDLIPIGFPRGFLSGLNTIELRADETIINDLKSVIKDKNIYTGLVVSGDVFIADQSQRVFLLKEFPEALCCEMEGAAVAHVCVQNNVPFCILRTMSDNANGNSGVDFATYSKVAGEFSAKILLDYLNK